MIAKLGSTQLNIERHAQKVVWVPALQVKQSAEAALRWHGNDYINYKPDFTQQGHQFFRTSRENGLTTTVTIRKTKPFVTWSKTTVVICQSLRRRGRLLS